MHLVHRRHAGKYLVDEKWVVATAKAVEEALYSSYSTQESLYKIHAMAILNQLNDRENTWIARCVLSKRVRLGATGGVDLHKKSRT